MSGRLRASASGLAGLVLLVLCAAPATAAPARTGAAPGPTNDDCLACHDEDKKLAGSLHGQAGLDCTDCHASLARTTDFPHAEKLPKVECGACHDDAAKRYAEGIHSKAREADTDSPAATCTDCHGSHDVQASKDGRSRTHPLRLAATCGACHGNPATIERARIQAGNVPKLFEDSIHGRALRDKGLVVAPNCAHCHGSHDIRRAGDPASRVHRDAIPGTCGGCHEGIRRSYEKSIHWELHRQGNAKGAVCSDCHTAHGIRATKAGNWRLDEVRECGTCHEARIRSYRDGFHGKLTGLGYERAATCADCHGSHAIRPGSDPASAVHEERRTATCGKCHANAGRSFVRYDPHADPHDEQRNRVLYYTQRFMRLLLGSVFAFFSVHTALWLQRSLRDRRSGEE